MSYSSDVSVQPLLVELLAAVAERTRFVGKAGLDWNSIKQDLDAVAGAPQLTPRRWKEMFNKHLNIFDIVSYSDNHNKRSVVSQLGGTVQCLDTNLVDEIKERGRFPGPEQNVAHTAANNLKYKPNGNIRNVLPLPKKGHPERAMYEDLLLRFEHVLQYGLAHICSHDTSRVIHGHVFSKMRTDVRTAVQRPHQDYEPKRLEKKDDQVFIGFIPLTKAGMYLEVWPAKGGQRGVNKARLIYIPYGVLLLLPGRVIHAGGFRTTEDGNLRCHLYLFPKGTPELDLKNIYADGDRDFVSDYFHAECLTSPQIPAIFI